MPFQKGHKLSTGRPKGSQNKELAEAKKVLSRIIFEKTELIKDFNKLDTKGKMEFRCRMAKFVMPEQKQIEVDNTNIDSPRLTMSELRDVYKTNESELPQHK